MSVLPLYCPHASPSFEPSLSTVVLRAHTRIYHSKLILAFCTCLACYTLSSNVYSAGLFSQQDSSYATRCSFWGGAVTFNSLNQLSTTFKNDLVLASSRWTETGI